MARVPAADTLATNNRVARVPVTCTLAVGKRMARVPTVITFVTNLREASKGELVESAKAGQRYNFAEKAISGTIRTLDKTGMKDGRTNDLYFQCDCQQCRQR